LQQVQKLVSMLWGDLSGNNILADCGGKEPPVDCPIGKTEIELERVRGNIVNIVATYAVAGRDVLNTDCVGIRLDTNTGTTYMTADYGDVAEIETYASTLLGFGISKPDGSPIDASNISFSTSTPFELILSGIQYTKAPQAHDSEAVTLTSYIAPECREECNVESLPIKLCVLDINNGSFLYHGVICEMRNWAYSGSGFGGPYSDIPATGGTLWLQGAGVNATTPISDATEDLTEIANLTFGVCPAPDNPSTINPDSYSLLDYGNGFKTFHAWHSNGFVTKASRFKYLLTHLSLIDCSFLQVSASTLGNEDEITAFDWEISPGTFNVIGSTASAGPDPLATELASAPALTGSLNVSPGANGVAGEQLGTIDITTLTPGWYTWRAIAISTDGKHIESTHTFCIAK